jgi:hypothetical protein
VFGLSAAAEDDTAAREARRSRRERERNEIPSQALVEEARLTRDLRAAGLF